MKKGHHFSIFTSTGMQLPYIRGEMLVDPSRFIIIIMIPQFLAKYVFGMDEFLYIVDPKANAFVLEVIKTSGVEFETSTKHRIVEFYSPYCVRSLRKSSLSIYEFSVLKLVGLFSTGSLYQF